MTPPDVGVLEAEAAQAIPRSEFLQSVELFTGAGGLPALPEQSLGLGHLLLAGVELGTQRRQGVHEPAEPVPSHPEQLRAALEPGGLVLVRVVQMPV